MSIEKIITSVVNKYSKNLDKKIQGRKLEMESDDNSHFMIYNALGICDKEGKDIDLYQNTGRFLYKYAGSMLEETTIACYKEAFPEARAKVKLPNTVSIKPKTVEIDCLVGNRAYEIKWRDATTDGDHVSKEHTRIKVIMEAGFQPIRIMFYKPQRKQALKIQKKLKSIYEKVGGEYYAGKDAWKLVKKETGIDLYEILNNIEKEVLT